MRWLVGRVADMGDSELRITGDVVCCCSLEFPPRLTKGGRICLIVIPQYVSTFLHLQCVTKCMSKYTVPVTIWGVPAWKGGGRRKILHLGTPRNHKVFVPIWGLTYLGHPLKLKGVGANIILGDFFIVTPNTITILHVS